MSRRATLEIGFAYDQRSLTTMVKSVESQLSKISLGKTLDLKTTISADIERAATAATKLGTILQQSMNVNTGHLDLSAFSEGLQRSGMSLAQYRQELSAIGREGDQAFLGVARAITQAELPLTRSNKLIDSLWKSMKSAVEWQLSASVMNGFVGSLEKCYSYAQNLNSALNDIRIVTGYTIEDMAAFTKQANEAAQALSSTTIEYAKASLIYAQQGLNDEQIARRTEATLKMANVTGQTAREVSDQMTAIWNNFDNGSKSLEYYIDVITGLGAATASSSKEISDGLQKFAAIADTVGLSYENATAALATIVAKTRESANTVGTALKALFSRIQGLQLGDFGDIDLNKYTKALQSVGISVFDQNEQLKDMDNILYEIGERWKTLDKAQKLALAETVAGIILKLMLA